MTCGILGLLHIDTWLIGPCVEEHSPHLASNDLIAVGVHRCVLAISSSTVLSIRNGMFVYLERDLVKHDVVILMV